MVGVGVCRFAQALAVLDCTLLSIGTVRMAQALGILHTRASLPATVTSARVGDFGPAFEVAGN